MRIKNQVKKRCKICKNFFFVIQCRKKTAKFCSPKCQGKSPYPKSFGKRMRKILLGKPKSKAWRKKASFSKINEKNPMWKGEKAGLDAIHIWVHARKKKSKFCEKCQKNKPYDLANISGKYKRDINDFEWLCRRCHMISDNRLENFITKSKKLKD